MKRTQKIYHALESRSKADYKMDMNLSSEAVNAQALELGFMGKNTI